MDGSGVMESIDCLASSSGTVLQPVDIFKMYLSNKFLGKSQTSCMVELDGFERAFGYGEEDMPMVQLIYGLIYRDQADLYKSERTLQLALQGFEILDHEFTPLALLALGTVYMERDNIHNAELAFAQALIPHKTGTLVAIIASYNLAYSFGIRGRLEASEALFSLVQRDLATLLGHTHWVTLLASCHLADLYMKRGASEQLTNLHQETVDRIDIETKLLGSEACFIAGLVFRAMSLMI